MSKLLKGKKALLVSSEPKSVIEKQLANAEESYDIKLTMEALWSDKTGFIDLLTAKTEPQRKAVKASKKATAKRKQLSSRVNEEEMEGLQEQAMEDEENETNLALN